MRVKNALLLSDLHLGWSVCARQHERLLKHLPEAADDAELIVLNGDIIDVHRGQPRGVEADLVAQLDSICNTFRSEGRKVVYIEGNHDTAHGVEGLLGEGAALKPDRWLFDWEGASGERIRVLHGHRFGDAPFRVGAYEGVGRHLLRVENHLYAHTRPLRAIYRMGPGWFVGAVGHLEDVLWIRDFPARLGPLLPDVDVLVHGHFHFGHSRRQLGRVAAWRTGAWVSDGHLGSVDRMLRYRAGQFERIGLVDGKIRAFDDGL